MNQDAFIPGVGYDANPPLHNVDGWELVEFDAHPPDHNLFTYRHPEHGTVEVWRSKSWRRRTPVEPRHKVKRAR